MGWEPGETGLAAATPLMFPQVLLLGGSSSRMTETAATMEAREGPLPRRSLAAVEEVGEVEVAGEVAAAAAAEAATDSPRLPPPPAGGDAAREEAEAEEEATTSATAPRGRPRPASCREIQRECKKEKTFLKK